MSAGQKLSFARSLNRVIERKIDDFENTLGMVLPCKVTKVEGTIVTVAFEVLPSSNKKGDTFPPVVCPIAESAYVRLPVQIGDYGILLPADVRLGGISGLGKTGIPAPLGLPSNLGGYVFMPIGNKDWNTTDPVDPDALNLNGKNGVVIRDKSNACVITLTPTGVVTTIGGTTFTINGTEVTATNGASTIHMDANSIDFTSPNINLNGAIGLNGPFTQTSTVLGTTGYIIGPMEVLNNLSSDATITGATDVKTGSGISLKTHKHGGVQTGGAQTTVPV